MDSIIKLLLNLDKEKLINEVLPSLVRTLVPLLTAYLYAWLGSEFIDEGTLTTVVASVLALLQYAIVRAAEAANNGPVRASFLIGGKVTPKYKEGAQSEPVTPSAASAPLAPSTPVVPEGRDFTDAIR